jgi:hypothetical protein
LCFTISLTLMVTACLPINTPLAVITITPTPMITVTASPEIVWFPPTATSTPFPTATIQPTQEMKPGIGEILLSDNFQTGSEWLLGTTTSTSVAIGKNELTIAITAPHAYAYSYRDQPKLSDFYVEIDANPTLCRATDEYGLLLRFASPNDFYRFGITCDGQVSLDRVYKGKASSPQPWISSGVVTAAAPSTSHLAVWAVGKEIRCFVNGIYLFSVMDPTIPSGSLGVYAAASGNLAVTVNFSNLVVREITP